MQNALDWNSESAGSFLALASHFHAQIIPLQTCCTSAFPYGAWTPIRTLHCKALEITCFEDAGPVVMIYIKIPLNSCTCPDALDWPGFLWQGQLQQAERAGSRSMEMEHYKNP